MSEAIPLEDNFDWWWYKSKRNYLKFIINQHNFSIPIKILEIGPGKGNNIELLNSYGEVSVLEIEEEFILHLDNKKFIDKEKIFSSFEQLIDKYKFDLIVLLDVLEHIEDTSEFLSNINKVLEDDGRVIFAVPAYQTLWSKHDEDLKHIKRYNWRLVKNEIAYFFDIEKRYAMNYLLLPIRFLQLKLFNSPSTLDDTSKTLNSILYFFAFIEKILLSARINPRIGLSLYFITKKSKN